MGIPDYLTCLLRNLYAGHEATVRTRHGTTDWFKIRKGVCQGCIFSPTYLTYMQSETETEVAQSCPTLCNPMYCSLPCSSIHGIFQARILEWVAISFSRGSSQPKDWTRVSCIVGRHFTVWATREASYMQSTSCKTPGWLSHKLASRLLGEIATIPDIRWHNSDHRKQRGTKEPLDES